MPNSLRKVTRQARWLESSILSPCLNGVITLTWSHQLTLCDKGGWCDHVDVTPQYRPGVCFILCKQELVALARPTIIVTPYLLVQVWPTHHDWMEVSRRRDQTIPFFYDSNSFFSRSESFPRTNPLFLGAMKNMQAVLLDTESSLLIVGFRPCVGD